MEEVRRGYRNSEDSALFGTASGDRSIVPDRISPSIEGYSRIPAVWIGEAPDRTSARRFHAAVHHAVMLRKTMHCGITVEVLRDGTFLFDFSSWRHAPTMVIPGYRIPDPDAPYTPPSAHIRAEEEAESYAILRAQVMNVHQALLSTSEVMLKRRSAMVGFPVSAWDTHKAITFAPPPYDEDGESVFSLSRSVLNGRYADLPEHLAERRILELDVVGHSLDLLDRVLLTDDVKLIQIIEALYLHLRRRQEKRFGEALALAWSVSEQLLSVTWEDLLKEIKDSSENEGRMSRARRDKLNGRDYSASVMIEILEVTGRIDHRLYRLLEISRKARNNWLHRLHVPNERELRVSGLAAQELLRHLKGIQLHLPLVDRGGVPQWPVWDARLAGVSGFQV